MRNLEQIRALHAHRFWDPKWPNEAEAKKRLEHVTGENGGDVVRGLGALITNCGLLATLAFAKQKGKGHETLMRDVGRFLGSEGSDGRHLLPKLLDAASRPIQDRCVTSLDDFIRVLTENNSALLQRATAEAMAYLTYLKRFAQ